MNEDNIIRLHLTLSNIFSHDYGWFSFLRMTALRATTVYTDHFCVPRVKITCSEQVSTDYLVNK